MSSYINHYRRASKGEMGWQVAVSWSRIAEQRLTWLYGPNHAAERRAKTLADIDAWNRLGTRAEAA